MKPLSPTSASVIPSALALALVLALVVLGGAAAPARASEAHDAFFANLQTLCGRTFAGRLVSTDAADAVFQAPLTLRVRGCTADTVRMPLQVGEDRSRTWIVTRTAQGLTLKHDHRHPDGAEDVLSRYGGSTTAAGTAERQDFPVDAYSRDLFERRNAAASTSNVWAMEIAPGRRLAYELNRPGRHVRLEFDLAAPAS